MIPNILYKTTIDKIRVAEHIAYQLNIIICVVSQRVLQNVQSEFGTNSQASTLLLLR